MQHSPREYIQLDSYSLKELQICVTIKNSNDAKKLLPTTSPLGSLH